MSEECKVTKEEVAYNVVMRMVLDKNGDFSPTKVKSMIEEANKVCVNKEEAEVFVKNLLHDLIDRIYFPKRKENKEPCFVES